MLNVVWTLVGLIVFFAASACIGDAYQYTIHYFKKVRAGHKKVRAGHKTYQEDLWYSGCLLGCFACTSLGGILMVLKGIGII